jgi:very-short-patch-repair endonuclease
MKTFQKNNIKSLQNFRKKLRYSCTPAEVTLWKYLQNKKLEGRKFRRQHSIGNYIIDFYCSEEKLAIELDGENHFWEEGIKHDKEKTEYLNLLGIQVLRFENKWVFEDIEYVIMEISKYLIQSI